MEFDQLCKDYRPFKIKFDSYLEGKEFSSLVIIADIKVAQLFPRFKYNFEAGVPVHYYLVNVDERKKNIEEVKEIWDLMFREQVDKNALIINWGGGMVSDLGGFAASTYKRGVSYINVPTTLLAMIDASVGGKTAINFNGIKNGIGTIYLPDEVFVDPVFLTTLEYSDILNGFGELIKYALIHDIPLWTQLRSLPEINYDNMEPEWFGSALEFKNNIVKRDLYDMGERRILNFGHTVGHALEGNSLSGQMPLNHGHAVALGICCEAYISYLHRFISLETAKEIKEVITRFYTLPSLSGEDRRSISELLKSDKKNSGNKINITLLKKIGEAIPNQITTTGEVEESLDFLYA